MSDERPHSAAGNGGIRKGSRPAADTTVASSTTRGPLPSCACSASLHASRPSYPCIVLLLGVLFFSVVVGERFFVPFNLSLIVQQVTIIGILGIAQTLVILTAGIDLSVGAIMVLCSVVMGKLAVRLRAAGPARRHRWASSSARCAAAINGVLVDLCSAAALHRDLGTWSIFLRAQPLVFAQARRSARRTSRPTRRSCNFSAPPSRSGRPASPTARSSCCCCASLFAYVLNRTAWGRHVYAVGDDADAARLAGIRTERTLISVYALAGLICAFAGWALIGRIGSVSPQAGQTGNLDSITAVVIGGTSLFGGRGSILGTLIGALIVGVFRNGLALSGVDVLWQEFTVGILIIVAVAIDQWIRKVCRHEHTASPRHPVLQARGLVKR